MSSPMVDRAREIPLSEKDYIPVDIDENENDTGFPFEGDLESDGVRSQLDNLAQRHPELAQHFGSFPFRSSSRIRSQNPDNFDRFRDRPLRDSFGRFGFPFRDNFDDDEFDSQPYNNNYSQSPHRESDKAQQEHGNRQAQPDESRGSGVGDLDNSRTEQEPERGRRPTKNIQQSNTVDLGQKQEPVDDRNPRSMSAPPPDSRPRFVSSINIPINPGRTNMGHQSSQPQPSAPSQHPTERVIPIHVEGRDEPVIPKKFTNQSHNPPPPTQSQPSQQQHSEKFFGRKPSDFINSEFMNQPFRGDWQQSDWFPRGFSTQNQQQQPPSHPGNGYTQKPTTSQKPQEQTRPQTSKTEQSFPGGSQTDSCNKPQRETVNQEEEPKPQPQKFTPIDQIRDIQKDVSALMAQVEQFAGQPRDKQYLYLDEMLTRNLIKLDNIDTQGQENIRSARREAIKCIERCIGVLDAKANTNAGIVKPMEVKEKDPEDANKEALSMEIEPNAGDNPELGGTEVKKDDTMEVATGETVAICEKASEVPEEKKPEKGGNEATVEKSDAESNKETETKPTTEPGVTSEKNENEDGSKKIDEKKD